jgi:hypothetical protein
MRLQEVKHRLLPLIGVHIVQSCVLGVFSQPQVLGRSGLKWEGVTVCVSSSFHSREQHEVMPYLRVQQFAVPMRDERVACAVHQKQWTRQ